MRSQLPWVAGRFRANRQVEVICRDRGASYSAAANSAAPQAVQVADRWHLFENASEAFLQAVRAELPRLRKALAPKAVIDPATLTRAERLQWEGALARTAINEQVEALASTGTPIKQIARTTGVARQTVRRILRGVRHDVFRSRQSSLDPWQLRLEAEWDAGCRNGSELWRRLRAAGFTGGLRVVTEWATKRRRDEKTGQPAGASVSARSIARDMTSERSSGSARVAMVNAIVETASPALIEARSLMDQFHAMMRTRKPEKLEPWLAAAKESNIAAFAAGIETDQAAVRAAIVEPWSSGQVEGQVTRLKLVKRQMYGRANLDLLKARLMAA
jgi:transposase